MVAILGTRAAVNVESTVTEELAIFTACWVWLLVWAAIAVHVLGWTINVLGHTSGLGIAAYFSSATAFLPNTRAHPLTAGTFQVAVVWASGHRVKPGLADMLGGAAITLQGSFAEHFFPTAQWWTEQGTPLTVSLWETIVSSTAAILIAVLLTFLLVCGTEFRRNEDVSAEVAEDIPFRSQNN